MVLPMRWPNFTIKNVKIFDDSDEASKTFGRIKTFKVFKETRHE
jgi:hypothetical protein